MPEETAHGQIEPQAQGEEQQPEEMSPSEEPTEAQPQEEEAQLPEDAKERTKQEFEKLKAHNKELSEKLKQYELSQPIPSVFDYLNPQPVQLPVAPVVPQYQYQPQPQSEPQLVEDGYINTDVLQKQLQLAEQARKEAEEANRRAQEAEQRISRFEQNAETKRLYEAYPELDPMSEVFNKKAYDLVRNELTSQIVNSGSRDAMKAAEKMSEYFRKPQQNTRVLEQRKQASVQASSSRPLAEDDYERLKLQSRNNPEALLKRLEMNGY